MKRFGYLLPLALSTLLTVGGGVRADGDEPELRGRKLSEWLEMLRGQQAEKDRHVALLALGVAASGPSFWQPYLHHQRRAGLLAVELIGPGKSKLV